MALPLQDVLCEPHAVAVLPFFQTAYHRVPRQRKTEPRANLCYFLNFGYNHGRDCSKLLDADIGKKVVFSRVFTWYHPEAPFILPATAVGNPPAVHRRISTYRYQRLCPSSPRLLQLQHRYLHMLPSRLLPRHLHPLLCRHPHQLHRHRLQCRRPRFQSPRALVANCNTRNMRRCPADSRPNPCICSPPRITVDDGPGSSAVHAGDSESINEVIRNYCSSKDSPDMQTAHARDLHAPDSEAEASPHARMWRQSMNMEFRSVR